MNKKNFTLDDVENMIEDLGFKWNERQVFNPNEEKYKKLKHNSFGSNKALFLSLKNPRGVLTLALAQIDNTTFVLDFNGSKINASGLWENMLLEKEQGLIHGR